MNYLASFVLKTQNYVVLKKNSAPIVRHVRLTSMRFVQTTGHVREVVQEKVMASVCAILVIQAVFVKNVQKFFMPKLKTTPI